MPSWDDALTAHTKLTRRFAVIRETWEQFLRRWETAFTGRDAVALGWDVAEREGGLVIGACGRRIRLEFAARLKGEDGWEGVMMVLVRLDGHAGWNSAGQIVFQPNGETALRDDQGAWFVTGNESSFLVLARAVEMGLSVPPEQMIG